MAVLVTNRKGTIVENWYLSELNFTLPLLFSSMVLRSLCWMVGSLLYLNISTTIGWFTIKSGTDIHGPLRMNPHDFGDPLIFPLAST